MEKEISSSEIEVPSVLTPQVLAIGIILTIGLTTLNVLMVSYSTPGAMVRYHIDQGYGASSFTALAFSMIFATMIISWLQQKTKIDPKKFTIITAMVMTGLAYGVSYGYPFQAAYLIAQFRLNPVTVNNWGAVLPDWVPSQETANAIIAGGIPVPWAEWLPAYFVSLAWVMLSFTFLSAINLVMRRQMIEIERLEFPHATAATESINYVADPQGNSVKLKRSLIGFILTFAFTSNFWLGIWYPWFPSVSSVMLKAPWIGWHPGVFDMFWAAPAVWDTLPGTNGCLNAWPWFYAIAALLPLNMLLSAFIFAIIGQVILPATFIWTGVWTPKPVVTPGWSSHSSWVTWMTVTQMPVFIDMGMWLALAIIPMLLRGNWKYIRDTLTGALSKQEVEAGGISYKIAWGLLVVSFVSMLAFMMGALQMHFTAALVALIVWGLIAVAIVRVRGMSGANVTTTGESYGGLPRLLWVNIPEYSGILAANASTDATPSLFGSFYFTTMAANDNQQASYWAVGALNMEAHKLGSLQRIKPKEITIATFIAMIVASLTSFPILLALTYARGVKPEGIVALFGLAGAFSNVGFPNGFGGWAIHSAEAFVAYRTDWTIYFVSGFASMAALIWAFTTFPWFTLHPVGVLIGMGHFQVYGLGFSMGIVYLFKWIVLRYGGIRAYEDWVIPLMVGVILGDAFGKLVWGIAGISVGI